MHTHVRSIRLALAITLTMLAVAVAGSQSAQAISVPVLIEGVTIVDDGVALLTGTTDAEIVEVNGDVVEVGADGTFVVPIDLSDNVVVLEVLESPAETVTVQVPVDVLLERGGQGILDDLVEAGIALDVPSDGFQIVDGQMPVVEGRVLNPSELAALEINGKDVLRVLGPSGLFSVQPSSPGSKETIIVTATDRSGVSQTSTFSTTRVRSAIATRAGTSVSAAGAQGLRIAKIALDTRFLKSAKYLAVTVTVKDRRGFLVRGAALRLRALPSMHVKNGTVRAGFTNRLGKARFAYRLKASALAGKQAKYLAIATRAATPKNSATKKVTLRLPTAVTR